MARETAGTPNTAEGLIVSGVMGGLLAGFGYGVGKAVGRLLHRPPTGGVAQSESKIAAAGDDATRAGAANANAAVRGGIRPSHGTGWTLKTAGAEGKVVYRLWGGKSPLFGRAWGAARMDARAGAEAAFGKLTTGNTADRLAVGLVKPGMPYWSHIGLTGIEELWIATPEQSILVLAENIL